MKIYRLFFVVILCLFFAGCADIKVPGMKNFLKDPLGEAALKTGMLANQVVSIYGEPNMRRTVVSNEWNEPRVEWFYKADYSILPVGAGYLTEDLYLYFDGENLTNISRSPLGKKKDGDL